MIEISLPKIVFDLFAKIFRYLPLCRGIHFVHKEQYRAYRTKNGIEYRGGLEQGFLSAKNIK